MTTKDYTHPDDTLDEETAKELAKKRGVVYLYLDSLERAPAEALSRFQGEQIYFGPELPKLEAGCAEQLIELGKAGRLKLEWLRNEEIPYLDQSTFLALAPYADRIVFQNFGTMDTAAAEILGQCQGRVLEMYVDTMSEAAAKQLAMARMDTLDVSFPHLNPRVAVALAETEAGELLRVFVEDGVLTVESATGLSHFRGHELWLYVSVPPSTEAMQELAGFTGFLTIEMPAISPELAAVLADSEGGADLLLYKTPTAESLEILSGGRRVVTYLDEILGYEESV